MFALEEKGEGHFRSLVHDGRPARVFGGQMLGLALAAGLATVERDRPLHSMQALFVRAARSDRLFDFAVEQIADGRSFSSRHVNMLQDGNVALRATLSCHAVEPGRSFAVTAPSVPPPEGLESEQERRERTVLAAGGSIEQAQAMRHLCFEIRPVTPWDIMDSMPADPMQCFWVRPFDAMPSDPVLQQAALAYLSDTMLLAVALLPLAMHSASTRMDWGSLNHSLWLHRLPDFTDWMLWSVEASWAGNARAMARGHLFNRNGELIFSATQEGLARIYS